MKLGDFKRALVVVVVLTSLVVGKIMLLPQPAAAAVDPACDKSSTFLGLPTWYEYLDVGSKDILDKNGKPIANDKCAIKGPLDSSGKFDWQAALPLIILAIVEMLLRLTGLVAIGFVVVGGVRFISSQGEPDRLKQARNTIINALIGLVIAVSAAALVSFIGRTLAP